jgi:hypothetical protein
MRLRRHSHISTRGNPTLTHNCRSRLPRKVAVLTGPQQGAHAPPAGAAQGGLGPLESSLMLPARGCPRTGWPRDSTNATIPATLTAFAGQRIGRPMAGEIAQWEQCSQDDCIGVRLPATALCLAHAAEQAPDAFDEELKRISAEGTVDARGVLISAELLARLLDATPRKDDRPSFMAARFDGATFKGGAKFDRAIFEGVAEFVVATFKEVATFDGRRSRRWPPSMGRRSRSWPPSMGRHSSAGASSVGQPSRRWPSSAGQPSSSRPGSVGRPSRAGPGSVGRRSSAAPSSAGQPSSSWPGWARQPSRAWPSSVGRRSSAAPTSAGRPLAWPDSTARVFGVE